MEHFLFHTRECEITKLPVFSKGDKNGSIRAWSTSVNSFPMVTQFLGELNVLLLLFIPLFCQEAFVTTDNTKPNGDFKVKKKKRQVQEPS